MAGLNKSIENASLAPALHAFSPDSIPADKNPTICTTEGGNLICRNQSIEHRIINHCTGIVMVLNLYKHINYLAQSNQIFFKYAT